MSTFTVDSTDGVKLCVHETSGDGPTVLAAHATGFCGPVWRPFADELNRLTGARVLAPDLRGHGASPVAGVEALAWSGFGEDVAAVARSVGAPVVGVGHSMGGAALLMAEIANPGMFSALWCYEPIVFPGAPGRWEDNPLALGAERRRDRFASAAAALENYAAKAPMRDFDPDALTAYVEGGLEPTPEGEVRLRCRPETEAEIFRTGGEQDTFDHLGEVRCPVVVASGAQHPGSPAMFAPRLAEELPVGRLVTYEDLDHFGPLTQPRRLAAEVASLSTLRAG